MNKVTKKTFPVKMNYLDVLQVRTYARGLESLAKEIASSSDPRVLIDGLRLIARQQDPVAELLRDVV
jgi:hypothetical protein